MKIRKSIFLRLFLSLGGVLLVLFTCTFAIVGKITYDRSLEEQKKELITACDALTSSYTKLYAETPTQMRSSLYSLPATQETLYVFSNMLGCAVFVTEPSGITRFCTETYPCNHVYFNIKTNILETIDATDGVYLDDGRLGNLYTRNHVTVSRAITVDGRKIGYLFLSKSTAEADELVMGIIRTFLATLLIAMIMSYVILYLLMYRLTLPIRRLTAAAKSLSEGDFSSRVPVKGHDEVAELGQTFNSMAESLESLEKMRSSFVANVSHELKTPMTSISGFIDGILDGTVPPENQRHYLKIVSSETKRLARLVKTLLYLSKIEAGEESANLTAFNYASVVTDVIVSLEPKLAEKNMEIEGLEWDTVLNTYADRDMIFQVTYNLVENAVKYAPVDSSISFSMQTKGDVHRIAIKNAGKLSAEDCKHIFDRFYKVDKSRGLDSKSTGLGLYLVYTLLKIHGQSVSVASDNRSYVEFSFTLPAV